MKENVAAKKWILKLGFLYQPIDRLPHEDVDLLYYEIAKHQ